MALVWKHAPRSTENAFACDVLKEIWDSGDRRVITSSLAENLKRARDNREPKNAALIHYILAALYHQWNKMERAEYHLRQGFEETSAGGWAVQRYKKAFSSTRCHRRMKNAVSTFIEYEHIPYTPWQHFRVRNRSLETVLLDQGIQREDEEEHTTFVMHSSVVILAHECALCLSQNKAGEALHAGTLGLEMVRRATAKSVKRTEDDSWTNDHLASVFVVACLFLNCSIAYVRLNLTSYAIDCLKGTEYLCSLMTSFFSAAPVMHKIKDKVDEVAKMIDQQGRPHDTDRTGKPRKFKLDETYTEAMKLYQSSTSRQPKTDRKDRKQNSAGIPELTSHQDGKLSPFHFWCSPVHFQFGEETRFVFVRVPVIRQSYTMPNGSSEHSMSSVLYAARKEATTSKEQKHGTTASSNATEFQEPENRSVPVNMHLSQSVSSSKRGVRSRHSTKKSKGIRRTNSTRHKITSKRSFGKRSENSFESLRKRMANSGPTTNTGNGEATMEGSVPQLDNDNQNDDDQEADNNQGTDEGDIGEGSVATSDISYAGLSDIEDQLEGDIFRSFRRNADQMSSEKLVEEFGEGLIELISDFQELYRSKRLPCHYLSFGVLKHILRMLPHGVLFEDLDFESDHAMKVEAVHRVYAIRREGTKIKYGIQSYLDVLRVDGTEMEQKCIPIEKPRGPNSSVSSAAPISRMVISAAMRRYRILLSGKQKIVYGEIATKLQRWYRSIRKCFRKNIFQEDDNGDLPKGHFFTTTKARETDNHVLQFSFSVLHKIAYDGPGAVGAGDSNTARSFSSSFATLLPCFSVGVEDLTAEEQQYSLENISLKHLSEGRFPVAGQDTSPEIVPQLSEEEFFSRTKEVSFLGVMKEAARRYHQLVDDFLQEASDSPTRTLSPDSSNSPHINTRSENTNRDIVEEDNDGNAGLLSPSYSTDDESIEDGINNRDENRPKKQTSGESQSGTTGGFFISAHQTVG